MSLNPVIATIDFTTPADYTYNASVIEVTGGKASLINQQPTNIEAYHNFDNSFLNLWTFDRAVTLQGTASISSNELLLNNNDVSSAKWNASGITMGAHGTAAVRIKPNYSGAPTSNQFFYLHQNSAGGENLVTIYHQNASGAMRVQINDNTGASIISAAAAWGVFNPVAGTEYEIKLAWNVDAGNTRLYIDNVQLGGANGATGTVDSTVDQLLIGSETFASNFVCTEFASFNERIVTAIDWTSIPKTRFDITDPTIEVNADYFADALISMTETATKTGGEIKGIIKIGTVWSYWNGSAWIASNETYAQSNTVSEINANITSAVTERKRINLRYFIHSDDGGFTPELDEIVFTYGFTSSTADSIDICTVYWFTRKADSSIPTDTFKGVLSADSVKYKTQTLVVDDYISDTPDSEDGYTELNLIPNTDMSDPNNATATIFYNIKKVVGTSDVQKYRIQVPNQVSAILWDILL